MYVHFLIIPKQNYTLVILSPKFCPFIHILVKVAAHLFECVSCLRIDSTVMLKILFVFMCFKYKLLHLGFPRSVFESFKTPPSDI